MSLGLAPPGGENLALGNTLPQQVGEPQDPDPSVSPTFVAHNWFLRVRPRQPRKPTVVESVLMRLVRWFRSAWADAGKSGEWMADAFPSLSRRQRWFIRTEPRWDIFGALIFLAIPVLFLILVLVGLVIFLFVQLIDALT